jgi:ADP-heptose:LPS heptosyltransferase
MEPESSRLARCCAEFVDIDIDIEDRRNWDLQLTSTEMAKADLVLAEFTAALDTRPFLVINMGGKAVEKDWGVANWEKLRVRLLAGGLDPLDRRQWGLMVVGAAEDALRADAFLDGWSGPTMNACGRLSPRESGAAMRRAALFIGHDSGPLHLAAAVGLLSIGLFGNYNRPKLWHPLGAHVRIIHRMDGLEWITPDHILDQITAFGEIREPV